MDLQSSLRLNETNVFGSAGRFRTSRLLVIGQIALAVVVITAAGIMLRSLTAFRASIPASALQQLVSAQISLDRNACHSKGACLPSIKTSSTRAHGLPGVSNAALVDALPISGLDDWYVFDAEGHPRRPSQLAMEASSSIVSPGYLPMMDIHLRAAAGSFARCSGSSRAILVNQSLASYLWPDQDPIGKHLQVGHHRAVARRHGHEDRRCRHRCCQRHASSEPRKGLGLGDLPPHEPRTMKSR